MPLKPIAIAIALLALLGALWLLIVALRRWRQGRRWSNAFRVVPALCLLGLVAVLVPYVFGLTSPHAFFNAPAPVPDTASVYSVVGSAHDAAANGPWLVAVNARTGQQRWQHAHAAYATLFIQDDTMLYAVAYEAGGISLSAVDGATGAQTWREELPDVGLSSPGSPAVIVDGTLVLGVRVGGQDPGPTQLYAFRAADGRQLWNVPVSKQGELDGGSGLVFTHAPYDVVQAWSSSDGHHVWDGPRLDGQVVAGANEVFELTRNGDVIALSAQTGTVEWSSHVPGDADAGILAQRALYVTAHNGINASGFAVDPVVYAFDVGTGHQLWQYAPKVMGLVVLAASTQSLYLNDADGIEALRPADGRLLWHNGMRGWGYHTGSGLSSVVDPVLYTSRTEGVPPQQLKLLGGYQAQTYLYALDPTTGSAYWKMPIGPLVTMGGLVG